MAIIAVKAPASRRSLESNGVRAPLTADEYTRAMELITLSGAQVTTAYPRLGMALVRIPAEAAEAIVQLPVVDWIDPDRPFAPAAGVESVPRAIGFSNSNAAAVRVLTDETNVNYGINMVRAPQAWGLTTGSSSVVMLMSQFGMAIGHSDLPPIQFSQCGGYFDPCNSSEVQATWGAGSWFALHNGTGIVGVAPGIQAQNFYSWRVCSATNCYFSQFISGIDIAVQTGVKTLLFFDLSWFVNDASIASAVSVAESYGIVTISGAFGSPTNVMYPVSYSQVLGATGVLPSGAYASLGAPGSPCPNIGQGHGTHQVDVAAPWYNSQAPGAPGTWWFDTCGASIAASYVAGVASLIRSRFPSWSPAQVRNRITSTAVNAGDPQYFGSGIVDAYAAVQDEAVPPPDPYIGGPSTVPAYDLCYWDATATGGSPPYSFTWKVNSSVIGTGTSIGYANQGSPFMLELEVRDSQNRFNSTSLYVGISSGSCMV